MPKIAKGVNLPVSGKRIALRMYDRCAMRCIVGKGTDDDRNQQHYWHTIQKNSSPAIHMCQIRHRSSRQQTPTSTDGYHHAGHGSQTIAGHPMPKGFDGSH
jgi:hypothetical protein